MVGWEVMEEGDMYRHGWFHHLQAPSNAVRVRLGLDFHLKSKFQIATGKISPSALWMGGVGISSCVCVQIATSVVVLSPAQAE